MVSASSGKTISQATYTKRLEELAQLRKWELQGNWVDFESWYDFSLYAKDNVYVVGNEGSFTEPCFGFGLKWAVQSARLCARAIDENIDYDCLIREEILTNFGSFEGMKRFFDTAENRDYDNFVRVFKNPLVKKLAESGISVFKNTWLMRAIFPKI